MHSSDEFGFRKHLMGLDPRWDTEAADPPIDESKAVWLGHNGPWDLWAVVEDELPDGSRVYSFQAVSETDDLFEMPFDVAATVAMWRKTIAGTSTFHDREHAEVMLELHERLNLVRQDRAMQVTLDHVVGPEIAEEMREYARQIKRITETAHLN